MIIVRRLTSTTLLPKLLWVVLVALGISERNVAFIMTIVISAVCIRIYRKGVREQYWEPEAEGYARRWEDLVWSHSQWINPNETPEQAIERLAGPWRKQCHSPTTSKRSTSRARSILGSVLSARVSTRAGQSNSSTPQAPHLLPL